jgi:hypothetical protein
MTVVPDQRAHDTEPGDPNNEDLELLDGSGVANIAQTLIERFRASIRP